MVSPCRNPSSEDACNEVSTSLDSLLSYNHEQKNFKNNFEKIKCIDWPKKELTLSFSEGMSVHVNKLSKESFLLGELEDFSRAANLSLTAWRNRGVVAML